MTVISSDVFQLGAIRNTGTPPVTPATPAYMLARLSSESLNFQPTTIVSPELDPSGQVRDSILTGARTTGAVELPVSRHPYFDDALAAALRSDWATNVLKVGSVMHLYTLEKRFVNPAGGYLYHRINDAAVSNMSISIAPGREVSASVNYSGGTMEFVESMIAGSTYPDPGTRPLFASPEVSEITVAGFTNALCFSDLAMEFNSNVRGIECIGTLGFKEQVLGRFEATLRGTAYLASNDLLDYLVNQNVFAATVAIDDSQGNKYEFAFPRCRMTSGSALASGTNQDVVNNMSIQAMYDPATATTVTITRTQAV